MITKSIDKLQSPDPIWRPHVHHQMVIVKDGKPFAGILGDIHCELKTGPGHFAFTMACGDLFGRGSFSIVSSKYIGLSTR